MLGAEAVMELYRKSVAAAGFAIGGVGLLGAALSAAAGKISGTYVNLYPPGIPLIVPGERINREAVEILRRYREIGFAIEGLDKEGWIEVWKDG